MTPAVQQGQSAKPPVQVKFTILADSGKDKKSTVHNVTHMQIVGDCVIYRFPREMQHISRHPILAANSYIKSAREALKARGQKRSPKVTLSTELKDAYFDAEGNARYEDEILEEFDPNAYDSDGYESEVETKKPSPTVQPSKALTTITKDIIIEKFNGRTPNPKNWIVMFERECARVEVPTTRYHEALRLFLDGTAMDWFAAYRLTISSNVWAEWKTSFLETFTNKGWSDVTFAYGYHYIAGSVSEYALKKLSLIVDVDPTTSDSIKVNLIVTGLPGWARNKLDRNEVNSVGKLLQKLNQIESLPKRNDNNNKSINSSPRSSSFRATEPCGYCLKKGFNRKHFESECRVKKWDEEKKRGNSNNNNNPKSEQKSDRPFKLNTTEVTELVNEQKN